MPKPYPGCLDVSTNLSQIRRNALVAFRCSYCFTVRHPQVPTLIIERTSNKKELPHRQDLGRNAKPASSTSLELVNSLPVYFHVIQIGTFAALVPQVTLKGWGKKIQDTSNACPSPERLLICHNLSILLHFHFDFLHLVCRWPTGAMQEPSRDLRLRFHSSKLPSRNHMVIEKGDGSSLLRGTGSHWGKFTTKACRSRQISCLASSTAEYLEEGHPRLASRGKVGKSALCRR